MKNLNNLTQIHNIKKKKKKDSDMQDLIRRFLCNIYKEKVS